MSAFDPAELLNRVEAAVGARTWTDRSTVTPAEARDFVALNDRAPAADTTTVPVGFGAALTMRAVLEVLHDDALALPFDANVHAAQELEWIREMPIGTEVVTTAWIENIRPRASALFFDVRTETHDNAGALYLRGTATQAVRHV